MFRGDLNRGFYEQLCNDKIKKLKQRSINRLALEKFTYKCTRMTYPGRSYWEFGKVFVRKFWPKMELQLCDF
jgi:hypothetical protein